MCWCHEYEWTINRADEYMVREKPDGCWYTISPHDVIALIQASSNRGEINVSIVTYCNGGETFARIEFV